jgi:hypothetical protein
LALGNFPSCELYQAKQDRLIKYDENEEKN